jgi:hypothetical protein
VFKVEPAYKVDSDHRVLKGLKDFKGVLEL